MPITATAARGAGDAGGAAVMSMVAVVVVVVVIVTYFFLIINLIFSAIRRQLSDMMATWANASLWLRTPSRSRGVERSWRRRRVGLPHPCGNRHYDSRRTFISLGLDGGASKDILQSITHPRPADAFDLCRTPSWAARCEAIAKLHVELRTGKVLQLTANVQGRGELGETEAATGLDALPGNTKAGIPFRNPGLVEWRGVGDSNPWPPA